MVLLLASSASASFPAILCIHSAAPVRAFSRDEDEDRMWKEVTMLQEAFSEGGELEMALGETCLQRMWQWSRAAWMIVVGRRPVLGVNIARSPPSGKPMIVACDVISAERSRAGRSSSLRTLAKMPSRVGGQNCVM